MCILSKRRYHGAIQRCHRIGVSRHTYRLKDIPCADGAATMKFSTSGNRGRILTVWQPWSPAPPAAAVGPAGLSILYGDNMRPCRRGSWPPNSGTIREISG